MDDERKVALYSLVSEDLKKIEDTLIENGGEITPEIEKAKAELDYLIQKKTDSIAFFIRMEEDEIDLAKHHMDRLKGFIKSKESRIERVRSNVLACMGVAGVDRFKGTFSTFSLSKKAGSVVIENENLIPFEFIESKPQIKLQDIKEAIKRGEEVPGAKLSEPGNTIKLTFKGGAR